MPLDLLRVAEQLSSLASGLQSQGVERAGRLERAIQEMGSADAEVVNRKRAQGRVTWLVPGLPTDTAAAYPPTPPPTD